MSRQPKPINYKKILGIGSQHKFLSEPSLEFSLVVMASLRRQHLTFESALELGATSDKDPEKSPFAGRNLYAFKEFFPSCKLIEGVDIFCPSDRFERDGIVYSKGDMFEKMRHADKSFDLVLLSAMLMDVGQKAAEKAIENAKRIARKYVVLVDIDTNEKDDAYNITPNLVETDVFKKTSGHPITLMLDIVKWARNYRRYFPSAKKIVDDPMPKYIWPGENHQFEARILTFYL